MMMVCVYLTLSHAPYLSGGTDSCRAAIHQRIHLPRIPANEVCLTDFGLSLQSSKDLPVSMGTSSQLDREEAWRPASGRRATCTAFSAGPTPCTGGPAASTGVPGS